MKKKISIITLAVCILIIGACVLLKMISDSKPSYSLLTEEEFSRYYTNFTITPGTDEWAELRLNEMWDQCRIDEDVLDKLSTNELMRCVLAFPLLGDICLFDTPQQARAYMVKASNAYVHLVERDDFEEVRDEWKKRSEEWGKEYLFQKMFLKIL